METWVLIIMIYGHSAVTVPGYTDVDTCNKAGKFAYEAKSGGRVWGWVCIPGPRK